MDRNCEVCKHHTEKGCCKWECQFEPIVSKVEKMTISFDENKQLNDVYAEIEKVINGMNKAQNYEVLNYYTIRAVSCVMKIHRFNSNAIDLNSMS